MTSERTALVLGATGGIGGEMARALRQRGWRVKALHRRATAMADDGLQWLRGDAMRADDVVVAAAGVEVIVHAVNPPGYKRWNELVMPMLESSIAAARIHGARIVLPGTVYNYGPDAFERPDENAPQRPLTRKGAIRVRMEQRLHEAAADGVRSLVVRAGDYFGPQAGNNWFGQCLVGAGTVPTRVQYPGDRGVGHQWGYLPDVAETMVRLLERESELATFDTFNMGGHWDADGSAMIAAIRHAVGRELPAKAFPWTLLRLASPFSTLFREMREMRYLWQQPLHLRNDKLVAFLGAEPHTPLDEAVRMTLLGLQCLPEPVVTQSASRLSQVSR